MQVQQSKQEIEQEFYDSLYTVSHSLKTVQTYRTAINKLRKFLSDHYQFDEFELKSRIDQGEIDVCQFLRKFVLTMDKEGVKAKGVRTYLSGIKGYLRHLGIKIDSDDFKQLVRLPKVIKTREIPLDKDTIARVLRHVSPKLQTAILIAASSGLRVGEICRLRISDIDFTSTPTKIHVRADATKTRQARETFISAEATHSLKDYLRTSFGWDESSTGEILERYIFGKTTYKGKKPQKLGHNPEAAKLTLQSSLLYYMKKNPELLAKNENGYHSIHFHGFRKFFRTNVGNVCGRDYAEALMGHGFYMDTYYQLPDDKKTQMYLDAEPHLTISDAKAVEGNFKDLRAKYHTLESKMNGIMSYLEKNSIPVPKF